MLLRQHIISKHADPQAQPAHHPGLLCAEICNFEGACWRLRESEPQAALFLSVLRGHLPPEVFVELHKVPKSSVVTYVADVADVTHITLTLRVLRAVHQYLRYVRHVRYMRYMRSAGLPRPLALSFSARTNQRHARLLRHLCRTLPVASRAQVTRSTRVAAHGAQERG